MGSLLAGGVTPPGDSFTYVNPNDPTDQIVSMGDWVQGRPGVGNAKAVRDALDRLKTTDIVLPVWDATENGGANSAYRVADFALVRLVDYQLPRENRISVRFLGFTTCSNSGLLDDFNRPDGDLGSNWLGPNEEPSYDLIDQRVDVNEGGPLYWMPHTFGVDQEAHITFVRVDPNGLRQSLLLKVQQNEWGDGVIVVYYDAATKQIGIATYVPGQEWSTLATFEVTLDEGDRFIARAEGDGTVRVVVNGVEVGAANAGDFFVNKGGRMGLWFTEADEALLDDFDGGNTPTVIAAGLSGVEEDLPDPVELPLPHDLYLPLIFK